MSYGILTSHQQHTSSVSIPYPAPTAVALLLDTYTNAKVAYSFRKLRAAYAGSAVRIRRSSDNTEQDIGFAGNDFDSSAASSFIGGGSGFIVKWYDQSGSGVDVTNSTAAWQPQYVASAIGSLSAMQFVTDAINPLFLLSGIGALTISSTSLSGFSVGSMNNAGNGYNRVVSVMDNSQSNDFDNVYSAAVLLRDNSNQGISAFTQAQKSIKAITYGTKQRWASIWDTANNIVYVNGSAGTTVGSTPTFGGNIGTATVGIGANPGTPIGGNDGGDGIVGEIVIWASDKTSSLSGIDANQSTYWGV